MVANGFEPLPLLVGEFSAFLFLLRKPLGKAFIHLIVEGPEFIVLMKGEANQGNDVGQDLATCTAHF